MSVDNAQLALRQQLLDDMRVFCPTTFCSRVWLGHGHVLFVEADVMLPFETQRSPRKLPYIDFHTHFAEWRIYHNDIEVGNRYIDTGSISSAADSLAARPFERSAFDAATAGVDLFLNGNWRISCIPWNPGDLSEPELQSDAWALKVDGNYYGMSCLGVINVQKVG